MLRGCIIADFYFGGKRVVGVNVRPSWGCCLVCGFVGGWLLGCRESAKSVFQKSELASCSRSDSGLLKNNADFRQPRISSPPAEADQTASPARAVRFKAVGLGWLGGSWMSRQRCAGRRGGKAEFPCDCVSALSWMAWRKTEFPCGCVSALRWMVWKKG